MFRGFPKQKAGPTRENWYPFQLSDLHDNYPFVHHREPNFSAMEPTFLVHSTIVFRLFLIFVKSLNSTSKRSAMKMTKSRTSKIFKDRKNFSTARKSSNIFYMLKAFFVRHPSEYEASDSDRKVNQNLHSQMRIHMIRCV